MQDIMPMGMQAMAEIEEKAGAIVEGQPVTMVTEDITHNPQQGIYAGAGRDIREGGGNRGRPAGDGEHGRYHPQQGVRNPGPYNVPRQQQQDYSLGPSLFDRIPREQNYFTEITYPQAAARFQYPTAPSGPFARRMSQITCNPTTANQGTVPEQTIFSKEMFEQLQLALTVQLGLNGPQQVKERALHNVLTNKSARGDMKQVLQSRAEIYGDALEPN